jgi:Tol biopolymer transport system component
MAVGIMPVEAGGSTPGGVIFYSSDRTTGKGVNNPTEDLEIFSVHPDGTGRKQLTRNTVSDTGPVPSPNGRKVAYESDGAQPSNTEGDSEVYVMNADGSRKTNLTNTGDGIDDVYPDFSPDNAKIAYTSIGTQPSNTDGDQEVFVMNANGSNPANLTNNGAGIHDYLPDFSPDNAKIAYTSRGVQTSNTDGDEEIFVMNANGSNPSNLTNSSGNDSAPDYSPNGTRIAYTFSAGGLFGDVDVYTMVALDGTDRRNVTNTTGNVLEYSPDYSPDGKRIAFTSTGVRNSNPEGDSEVYTIAANGSGTKNVTRTDASIGDADPAWGKSR